MDAVKSFFGKYHAAPANNGGIDWPNADADTLIGWLKADAALLRTLRGRDREHVRERFAAAVAEAWRRVGDLGGEAHRHPADWPGRRAIGLLVAALVVDCRGLIDVTVK